MFILRPKKIIADPKESCKRNNVCKNNLKVSLNAEHQFGVKKKCLSPAHPDTSLHLFYFIQTEVFTDL